MLEHFIYHFFILTLAPSILWDILFAYLFLYFINFYQWNSRYTTGKVQLIVWFYQSSFSNSSGANGNGANISLSGLAIVVYKSASTFVKIISAYLAECERFQPINLANLFLQGFETQWATIESKWEWTTASSHAN